MKQCFPTINTWKQAVFEKRNLYVLIKNTKLVVSDMVITIYNMRWTVSPVGWSLLGCHSMLQNSISLFLLITGICFFPLGMTFTYWPQHYRFWIIIFTFSTASFMDVRETRNQFMMISIKAEDQNGRYGTKSYWSTLCWQIFVLKVKRAEGTNACQTRSCKFMNPVSNTAFLIKHCCQISQLRYVQLIITTKHSFGR